MELAGLEPATLLGAMRGARGVSEGPFSALQSRSIRDTGQTVSQENVEVVRRTYEALNRGAAASGLGSWVEIYYAQALYEPIEEEQPIRGHEELVTYFQRWLEAWQHIRWDLEEILETEGGQVVAAATVRATARTSGMDVEQRFFHVFDIARGRVARQQEYLDRADALKAVGLRENALGDSRP